MPALEFDFAKNQKQWQVFRNHIKQPENGGVLLDGWSPESGIPLPLFFQTMVGDIQKWFNPSQGWKLAKLTTMFISLPRMEQSSIDEEHPEKGPWLKTKVKTPDQFNPVFHFDADDPPLYRKLIGGRRLKFHEVFDPEFRKSGMVSIPYEGSADVTPDRVGSVFSLKRAICLLTADSNLGIHLVTAPYYLKGATVSLNSREIELPTGKQKDYEPPKSLMVMLFLGDLVDYLHLEKNNIRRVYDRLARKFPVELPKHQAPTSISESAQ